MRSSQEITSIHIELSLLTLIMVCLYSCSYFLSWNSSLQKKKKKKKAKTNENFECGLYQFSLFLFWVLIILFCFVVNFFFQCFSNELYNVGSKFSSSFVGFLNFCNLLQNFTLTIDFFM